MIINYKTRETQPIISIRRPGAAPVIQSLFTDPATGLMSPLPVAAKSNDEEIRILDLLSNAGNKEKTPAKPSNHETSPSGGEKLLSFSEQRNDENKENEDSNAAFLAQVSQASNTIAGNEVYICLGLV